MKTQKHSHRVFESKNKTIQFKEDIIKYLLITASIISVLTTFGILFSILFEALEFFKLKSFIYFLTGTEWSPGVENSKFGAVPIFAGTFIITIIAMCVALPIGVFSAIYMSEYASVSVRAKVKPLLEILAGIPTVVYGFFAAITVAPFIVQVCETIGIQASFNSALASGVVMGIMIIPVISSLSDDVISAVPDSQRKGALALGLTTAESIKAVILPAALPGIISACILGVSKALGETMIVVMAAGLRPNLTLDILEDMTTVTVRIVDALVGDQAFDSPATLSAFALGLVLFVVTLILNIISVYFIRKFKTKYKVNNL
ncbi:phosphate ABC transporter permease subunit PstC [Arcobacter sp. HD9-500m-PIT-SAG03]|nr:phosphate ABC transporter permease subunit PstC [Arcobacter sp. HD9-500m-PIT-SAG03]